MVKQEAGATTREKFLERNSISKQEHETKNKFYAKETFHLRDGNQQTAFANGFSQFKSFFLYFSG